MEWGISSLVFQLGGSAKEIMEFRDGMEESGQEEQGI